MAFCGKCGARLIPTAEHAVREPTSRVCHVCGKTMPSFARFCGGCGANLSTSTSDFEQVAHDSPDEPSSVAIPSGSTVGHPSPAAQPSSAPGIVEESDRAIVEVADRELRDPDRPQAVSPERVILPRPSIVGPTPSLQESVRLESPEGSLRAMVRLPGGWFAMGARTGSGHPNERPRHQVELTAFHIDRCSVSNLEFEQFDPGHRRKRPEVAEGDFDPVVFVAYQDCLNYCRWRAEREGVPQNAYTLPSEAQWEYAARGGFPDRLYPWGDDVDPAYGNTLEAGRGRTVAVDEGGPNPFGLFQMASNVREWCLDYYDESYYSSAEARRRDPTGPRPVMLVNMNVVRGAGFQDSAEELSRCSARSYAHPNSSSNDIGFRCVRLIP